MGVFNEAAVAAGELERVQKKLTTLFDRDQTFYATVEKRPVEKISARDMRIPFEIRPGGYFGHFDPDGGALGTGGGPTLEKGVINTNHLRYAIQWTKKAEWATDDARKAVVNTVRHLTANAMKDFRRHVDSLCMTAGQGILGEVSGRSDAGGGVDLLTLGNDGWGTRLLRHAQKVTVYANNMADNFDADGSTGVNVEISMLDTVNKQIKIPAVDGPMDASYAAGSGPYIGVEGMQESAVFVTPVSLFGVPYHHTNSTSGSWLGLTRSSNPEDHHSRGPTVGVHSLLKLPRCGQPRI